MIPCRIDLGGTFSTLMEYGNPALLDYTRDENKNKLMKGESYLGTRGQRAWKLAFAILLG